MFKNAKVYNEYADKLLGQIASQEIDVRDALYRMAGFAEAEVSKSMSVKSVEVAMVDGTFEELRDAILESDSGVVGQYDLEQLAAKAGLDKMRAHQLVTAIMTVTKRKVVAEVKKQSENLIYWVERA